MKRFFTLLLMGLFLSATSYAQKSSCDYKIEILTNGTEFTAKEFSFRMKSTKLDGSATNITGTAEIIDSHGNSVKKYSPWQQEPISRQKTSSSYSPNLKPDNYRIISNIDVECNDEQKENNHYIKPIKIKSESSDQIQEKKIDKNQETYATLTLGPTTETKNLTQNEIKNNPENKSNNEIQERHTNESIQPIEYDNEITLAADNPNSKLGEISADAVKEPKIVYESGNAKSKNLVVIFLLALSIMLNIVLIWKR